MDNNDFQTLARTIWGEARGETFDGKVAVAHVVLNRFRSGKWFAGKTIAATAKKKWQFSAWNPNDPNRAKMMAVNMSDKAFRECALAALGAMTGHFDDATQGSTHYHTSRIHPKWAKGKTSVCIIGHHVFYDDID